jgi:hypothetical protein
MFPHVIFKFCHHSLNAHMKSGHYCFIHYTGVVQNLCLGLKLHMGINIMLALIYVTLLCCDVDGQFRSTYESQCLAF